MSTALRWGVLGTALINRRLIPAMRAARRSVVAAVASREESRASSYAQEWQIPTVHRSYEALLKDPRVDAVYIPLPNTMHVEWTLRALDAGKHVLCEKPLALTPSDVDRVAAVAKARERVVAEAFMYRHEPLIARVLQLARTGTVGTLTSISSGFTFVLDRPNDVRFDTALGGGSLWDVGCYGVSAARLIAGAEPVEVFGWATLGPTGIDQAFTGLLKFPGGLVATVHSAFTAAYRTWIDIAGTEGVLRVTSPFKPTMRETVEVTHGDTVSHHHVEGSPLLYVRQIEDFVASAIDGRVPTVSLADSRGNAAALAALAESSRAGRPVQL